MNSIRINAAAAMLGVSSSTLRSWERRYGFPAPGRSEGNHRQFDLGEIEALRTALQETGEIAAAIAIASSRGSGLPSEARLRHAFGAFDSATADALLEESVAVRSIERTIDSVLIAAVQQLAEACSTELSAELCFAWRYATAWMCSLQRMTAPANRSEGVLIFDATSTLELDALRTQALELFLRRAGLRVLSLPTELPAERMGNALRALNPSAIVLGGSRASLDEIARLIYAARQVAGDAVVLDFGGAIPDTGASTIGRLGASAAEAALQISSRLADHSHHAAGTVAGTPRRSRRFIRSGTARRAHSDSPEIPSEGSASVGS